MTTAAVTTPPARTPAPSVPAVAGVLLAYAVCTWQQVSYWRDSVTLWRRALAVTEDNFLAHVDLGAALIDRT